MFKKAFTLAEVLITLTIIGVVSALTVPTLHQKYGERATINQLNKFYTILSQAYSKAIVEYGVPSTWNILGSSEADALIIYERLFKENFKIMTDCGFDNEEQCMTNDDVLLLNNTNVGKQYSENTGSEKYYKLLLSDGSSIWFSGDNDYYINTFIDLNGPKKPNQRGKDIFSFLVLEDKIVPAGVPGYSNNFDNSCSDRSKTGYGCSAWVIYKGNMDYLRCDDLTWTGKQKCSAK